MVPLGTNKQGDKQKPCDSYLSLSIIIVAAKLKECRGPLEGCSCFPKASVSLGWNVLVSTSHSSKAASPNPNV